MGGGSAEEMKQHLEAGAQASLSSIGPLSPFLSHCKVTVILLAHLSLRTETRGASTSLPLVPTLRILQGGLWPACMMCNGQGEQEVVQTGRLYQRPCRKSASVRLDQQWP